MKFGNGFCVPELALLALDEIEDVLGIAPVFADADLEVKIDLMAHMLLDLAAGASRGGR